MRVVVVSTRNLDNIERAFAFAEAFEGGWDVARFGVGSIAFLNAWSVAAQEVLGLVSPESEVLSAECLPSLNEEVEGSWESSESNSEVSDLLSSEFLECLFGCVLVFALSIWGSWEDWDASAAGDAGHGHLTSSPWEALLGHAVVAALGSEESCFGSIGHGLDEWLHIFGEGEHESGVEVLVTFSDCHGNLSVLVLHPFVVSFAHLQVVFAELLEFANVNGDVKSGDLVLEEGP